MEKLTLASFKEKISDFTSPQWKYLGPTPAIIDFYADWCGPCKMVGPVLEDLEKEYAGKFILYKVDIDAEDELAAMFNIMSIPSMVFIPMIGDPRIAVGALPKGELEVALKGIL